MHPLKLTERINTFSELGERLGRFMKDKDTIPALKTAITRSALDNPYFVLPFQLQAIENLLPWLQYDALNDWTKNYRFTEKTAQIGVIMAGNIPLAGFHDFLSTLISGHKIIVKHSKKDRFLLPAIAEVLTDINPRYGSMISFVDETPKQPDALIATGSNNTARYFEYNYRTIPRIVRHNRHGLAVLDGSEATTDYSALADDICTYYGLGCRNVSKIFLPDLKLLDKIQSAIEQYQWLLNNKSYSDNLTWQKARLKTLETPFIDAGPVILINNTSLHSPLGIVHYEMYQTLDKVQNQLAMEQENIQCIVGKNQKFSLPLGSTQKPVLSDYADDTDTLKFLTEKV